MQDYKSYFIPTFHPSFLLRGAQYYHEVVVADLQRAARIAEAGTWEQSAKVYKLLPNGQGNVSVDWAVNWINENLAQNKPVAVDTETYGVGHRSALDQYSCKLHAVGISFSPSNEALSWLADGTLGWEATQRMNEALRRVMGGPNAKIFHNMGYDVEVLLRHGFRLGGQVYDTVVLHHLTDPELDHDLAFVSHQFLDTEPWKVDYRLLERKGLNSLERLLHYNGRDALATQQICNILIDRVVELKQEHIAQYEFQTSELAGRMGRTGIPIDEEKRRNIEIKLLTNREEALKHVRETMAWSDFDPQKPSHRFDLIYGRLKLPVKFYTKKKGTPSTGRRALIAHLNQPVVRALMQFDENAKLLSTFVKKLPAMVDDDGRLHPHWNSAGTVGSRWSSSDPNFQNWRKWLREIVTTKPGRVLVGADSKAIEYRIVACLSGCKKLISAFNENRDVHSEVSKDIFGESFTKLPYKSKEWSALRDLGKRVVYARNYRAQPKTICENLKQDPKTPMSIRAILTPAYIDKISRNFDKAYPEIGAWAEREWDKANRTGKQEIIPLGRIRYHSVLPVEDTKAANIPAQDAAGDFQNLALLEVDKNLPKNAYLVLTVHDQIVVECDDADAENVKTIIEKAMTFRVEGPAGYVMLEGEGEVNRSWDKV